MFFNAFGDFQNKSNDEHFTRKIREITDSQVFVVIKHCCRHFHAFVSAVSRYSYWVSVKDTPLLIF